MILQTGKKRRRAPSNRLEGFTLIELVIVASLILVLVAVSNPLFRATFRDLELKDSAYNISKMIRYAQASAVMEEAKYKIVFDFDKRAYWLLVENEKSAETQFERVIGRFKDRFYLPRDVFFTGENKELIFLPNGRCTKASVIVVDKDKKRGFEVKTTGKAGQIEIIDVKEK
jgi:type II secretory pathway pseudopilin PulG